MNAEPTTDANPETVAWAVSSDLQAAARTSGSIPGYEILRELGRGGMGLVYLARQTNLNRIVALKTILRSAESGEAELRRFLLEAQSAARLAHPNIVQVHEVGESEGLPFFSMEFVEGGSLECRLDGRPLPPDDAARLVEKLARAMAAAHRAGVVHRDLKPANILLAGPPSSAATGRPYASVEGCEPKIADFGLAKGLEGQASLTSPGAILGTPSYMAPEQARGESRAVGPSADIYSLGAVLYTCLAGRPPFAASTPLDAMMQAVSADAAPPSSKVAGVPRDLDVICLKCLEKSPSARYPSADLLADDLRRYLVNEPIQAIPATLWQLSGKWVKRRPAVAAMLALCLVLLVLTGPLLFGLWREAERELKESRDALARQEQRSTANGAANGRQPFHLSLPSPDGIFSVHSGEAGVHLLDHRTAQWRPLRASAASETAFSPDSRYFAFTCSAAPDAVVMCDLKTGGLASLETDSGCAAKALAFQPGGRLLAAAFSTGAILAWDRETQRLVKRLDSGQGAAGSLSFDAAGGTLRADGEWGFVEWNVADWTRR